MILCITQVTHLHTVHCACALCHMGGGGGGCDYTLGESIIRMISAASFKLRKNHHNFNYIHYIIVIFMRFKLVCAVCP